MDGPRQHEPFPSGHGGSLPSILFAQTLSESSRVVTYPLSYISSPFPPTPVKVLRVRKEACRILLHGHNALALREALLPSRSTPGLWQSIDQTGLAAADSSLTKVLSR